MKLLAVVHVGSLSGVRVVGNEQQQQPASASSHINNYELHGAALDVCRQMLTQTTGVTEPYTVKVTEDAFNDGGGDCGGTGLESLTLVRSSTCVTVSERRIHRRVRYAIGWPKLRHTTQKNWLGYAAVCPTNITLAKTNGCLL